MSSEAGRRRGPVTAGQLMAELAQDEDYQQRTRQRRRRHAARLAEDQADWQLLNDALTEAGMDPTDVGRFVNDTTHFHPSTFDERAAMPVLLAVLPRLSRPAVIGAVAAHLGRPWARPAAFPALADAFVACVRSGGGGCWGIADAAARAADKTVLDDVLRLALDSSLGPARAPLVYSLWRYRRDERAVKALEELVSDPAVDREARDGLRRARRGRPA